MKPASLIRAARLSDERDLLSLIRAYYRFDSIAFDRKRVSGALRTLLRKPSHGKVWVVANGKSLAAYLVLTFNHDLEFGGLEGIVTELFVDVRSRGHGLGRKLIDAARSFCHKSGIGTIELQVSRNNRAARAFYMAQGFREFDRVIMAVSTAPFASRKRKDRS